MATYSVVSNGINGEEHFWVDDDRQLPKIASDYRDNGYVAFLGLRRHMEDGKLRTTEKPYLIFSPHLLSIEQD